jgi:SAM-dependent methyltransferase
MVPGARGTRLGPAHNAGGTGRPGTETSAPAAPNAPGSGAGGRGRHSLDRLLPADSAPPTADTAARSLAHWSEAGRDEMEAFYAFARLDYELLAGVMDWGAALAAAHGRGPTDGPLPLLDVACGSGKFPAALLRADALDAIAAAGVRYDLLDPSAFSIAEAATVLRAPLREGAHLQTTLEALDPATGPWDVVWATHALYALEPAALPAAAERFAGAISAEGFGFMAQGAHDGHYLTVYRAFLEGVRGGAGTPYLSGEQVADALTHAAAPRGLVATRRHLRYEHHVPVEQHALLEGYLQRCLFDDTLALGELLDAPVLGAYLEGCRDDAAGAYRFPQDVVCLALTPEGATPTWTAGS